MINGWNVVGQNNRQYQVEIIEAGRGAGKDYIWTQARAAVVPKRHDTTILMTMSKKLKSGSDVYHDLYEIKSYDHGQTWTDPEVIPTLKMHHADNGYKRSMSDMTPRWHEKTQKVINIGKSFYYSDENGPDRSKRGVAYAVYDPDTDSWGPFNELRLPEYDVESNLIVSPVAGCVQFHIEDNGDILLPVFYYPLNREQAMSVNKETFEVANFMSNTATANLLLPIIAALGVSLSSLDSIGGAQALILGVALSASLDSAPAPRRLPRRAGARPARPSGPAGRLAVCLRVPLHRHHSL